MVFLFPLLFFSQFLKVHHKNPRRLSTNCYFNFGNCFGKKYKNTVCFQEIYYFSTRSLAINFYFVLVTPEKFADFLESIVSPYIFRHVIYADKFTEKVIPEFISRIKKAISFEISVVEMKNKLLFEKVRREYFREKFDFC